MWVVGVFDHPIWVTLEEAYLLQVVSSSSFHVEFSDDDAYPGGCGIVGETAFDPGLRLDGG